MVAWSSLLPLASLTLSAVVGTATAQDSADTVPVLQDVPNAYIVEFEGEYSVDALVSDLKGNDIDAEKRKDLKFRLFNGASLDIKGKTGDEAEEAAKKIAEHQKVKNLWPVRQIRIPDDKISSIGAGVPGTYDGQNGGVLRRQESGDTYNLHVQTQVDKLHAQGFTGKGIKIAVVDSGIDYKHPALGGCFGPGCKVSFGYDLAGDDTGNVGKFPDDDPMDCLGHGTHVAGILAADANELRFLGVAPDAELGAYRALSCLGYSTNEILISAFNMAYEAGADIITSSTGMEGGWADDAWSAAVSRIALAGVPVLISAGNSGEEGLWRPSTPAAGHGISSVASVDNTLTPQLFLAGNYTLDEKTDRFPWAKGYPPLGNITLPLRLLADESGAPINACTALADGVSLAGDVAYLIRESADCRHHIQVNNAAAKGAQNVIIYALNDSPEWNAFTTVANAKVVLTTQTQGKAWVEALAAGSNITVSTIDPDHAPGMAIFAPNTATGGYTSYWSSWGPGWEMDASPNLASPGGYILSTYPLALGSYAVASGTSMACPFAAGALALVSQKRKIKDAATLRTLLATTSKQLVHHDGVQADPENRFHSVVQGGPGLIQVFEASEAKGLLSKAYISFNDTENYKDVSFELKNTGSTEATYELGHRPAATVYALNSAKPGIPQTYPVSLAAVDAVAKLSFSSDVVTVAPGASVSITVKAVAPTTNLDLTRQPFYSGFVTLNGTNGDSLVLQYLGLAGTPARKLPIVRHDINSAGLPVTYVTASNNRLPIPSPENTTFSLPRPNPDSPTASPGVVYPQARTVLALGTRQLVFRVLPLDQTNNGTMQTENWRGLKALPGDINSYNLIPRDSIRQIFTGLMADGSVAPEGRYQIVAAALGLLGDRTKPEDWELNFLEPSFLIKYT